MSLSPDRFRATMAHLVAGVTVVALKDRAGRSVGMTASAVTALSLEPPMLLVCIDRSAAIHDLIVHAPGFSVSILADDQEDIARRYADPERHEFAAGSSLAGPSGLPLVDGALAHVECARGAVLDGGDHSVVTGTLEWSRTREGAPLVHFRSSYGRLAR
ncbi:MAG: flavin reductase family protein [Gemmatimonadales bacterium]